MCNATTHTIDPWPPGVTNRRIPANGERMVHAIERYRKGPQAPASAGPDAIGAAAAAAPQQGRAPLPARCPGSSRRLDLEPAWPQRRRHPCSNATKAMACRLWHRCSDYRRTCMNICLLAIPACRLSACWRLYLRPAPLHCPRRCGQRPRYRSPRSRSTSSDEPLHIGREQFGRGDYGIAERYFRDAVEKAPKRDVLERVMSGMSNKEIARDLKLGQGTVKIPMAGLYRTLGVKSRVAAAAAGLRMFHEREQNA